MKTDGAINNLKESRQWNMALLEYPFGESTLYFTFLTTTCLQAKATALAAIHSPQSSVSI